ncbi:MAG TPA: methionyl-tRNA formyltransferase [Ktedonobacterales bacterium]|nr:methionyl-tRNA formyltransferase [Ktedonobacterales bacterium]
MGTQRLRVVFFGMSGQFSLPPLEALLAADFDVRAVVVAGLAGQASVSAPIVQRQAIRPAPALGRALPMLAPGAARNILSLAAECDIPLLEVYDLADARTLNALAAFEPDAICVACFPRKLPSALLQTPRLGCLNVHPSLLPDNRGSDPLFWTFQRGDQQTGVTIHLMDEGLDSGPIVLQERVPIPDGVSESELEQHLARRGGTLLVPAVRGLAGGLLNSIPQDATRATSYSFPRPEDFTVTPERSARWAYNFICGVGRRAEPMRIAVADEMFHVVAALDFDEQVALDCPWRLEDDELWLQCWPGVLHARVLPRAA